MNVLRKMQKSTKHFSIPIEKEVIKIDKDGNEIVITISFKIKFIDNARQIHDQNLLIILQKKFIKLSVKIVIVFLNIKVSRTI